MKRAKVICVMSVFLGLSCVLCAQIKIVPRETLDAVASPRLSCDSAALGFDVRHIIAPQMNEDDAPQTFNFHLTNLGEGVLEIKGIRTTCSCVTARAGKTALEQGESTEIAVRYDPKGHPGKFERRIFVYTMEGNDPAAVLRLSVDVAAGADMAGEWPVQMGGIRMRRSEIEVVEGRRTVEKLRFINVGGKPLTLECEDAFLPGCLSFEVRPRTVQAGQEGEMVVTYDPEAGPAGENMRVILKGIGLPPTKSSITVRIKKQNKENN